MKPYYSKEVIKRFTRPKNFGQIKKADGIGRVGNPRCGDVMKLYIKVDDNEKIKDIRFHTLGCAAAIAASDMVCDLVRGKTIKQALKVDYKKVIRGLGDLPPLKVHCSVLAREGLKAAVDNYYGKKQKSGSGDVRRG